MYSKSLKCTQMILHANFNEVKSHLLMNRKIYIVLGQMFVPCSTIKELIFPNSHFFCLPVYDFPFITIEQ